MHGTGASTGSHPRTGAHHPPLPVMLRSTAEHPAVTPEQAAPAPAAAPAVVYVRLTWSDRLSNAALTIGVLAALVLAVAEPGPVVLVPVSLAVVVCCLLMMREEDTSALAPSHSVVAPDPVPEQASVPVEVGHAATKSVHSRKRSLARRKTHTATNGPGHRSVATRRAHRPATGTHRATSSHRNAA